MFGKRIILFWSYYRQGHSPCRTTSVGVVGVWKPQKFTLGVRQPNNLKGNIGPMGISHFQAGVKFAKMCCESS